jgi:WD40 repeat protein
MGPITQMQWDNDTQVLITCGKDKLIKLWNLPAVWIDEGGVQQRIHP